MKFAATRRILAILAFTGLFLFSYAQTSSDPGDKVKPYRILTSGKQITIKSTKDIKNVMVWTANGHRIVEQKDINASSYAFTPATGQKVFFIMLELENGMRYTEKIGTQ